MKLPSFDVLTEPWIPVIRLDGTSDELGIVPCLKEAQRIREIRDPAPIIEFGIYRLLVAFILDALILAEQRPEDSMDIQDLLEKGRFEVNFLEDYVRKCGDVFDLFHPDHPFLQTKMMSSKPKPIAGLFPAMPSGTNVGHWCHINETKWEIPVPFVARLLTTIAPFMTAGGAGLSPSINGAPPIYVLPAGESLYETLIFNLPLRNQDSGTGGVAWRSLREPGQERIHTTTVEALTWQPRRIQLIPEIDEKGDIYVTNMKFEKGDSTRLIWIDSNLGYRYKKDSVRPIRMRPNRPLWRDAGPLFLLNEKNIGHGEKRVNLRRPDVVEQVFSIMGSESKRDLVIQVYGMRTDMKMKVFEWAKSVWSVPAKLGQSTRLGQLVYQELERGEKVAYVLRIAIRSLFPRQGKGKKRALGSTADRCERIFWQHLEPAFYPLMKKFADLDPDAPDDPDLITTAASDWRKEVRNLAIEQFESVAKDMDSDSNALERQVRARARLINNIRKVLL